ncbi:hypothetical protein GCM10023184_05700 [Flaviaesturariibacter amylovorans]|uniref:Uncharacterized protein n=2 Tax=Flaviaesturariibacter amylovorans TaxID=1084520 RepID=A0ABP8GA75_9BACT
MTCYKKMHRSDAFARPYYEWRGDSAVARMGHYLPDLLPYVREEVFRPWKMLEPAVPEGATEAAYMEPDSLAFVERPRPAPITPADSAKLVDTWNRLVAALRRGDAPAVRALSLDSVVCSVCEGPPALYYENNPEPVDSLLPAAQRWFSAFGLWAAIEEEERRSATRRWISAEEHSGAGYRYEDWQREGPFYTLRIHTLLPYEDRMSRQTHHFRFVKRDDKIYFSGMDTNAATSWPIK